MHPIEGPLAKIKRAREHVDRFADDVRAYANTAPFTFTGQIYDTRRELAIVAVAVPNYPPIPLDLVLLAGEVAHQLRSSLDHLVWQLVLSHTGRSPIGTKSGFPIFKTEEGYERRAPSMIDGVSDNAARRIRGAQPFHVGARAEETLIWLVHELNNTDKHRMIPFVRNFSFVGQIQLRRDGEPPIDIVSIQETVGDAMHDGMEVARLPVSAGGNFSVDIRSGFDIAFAEIGALRNHPATDLLVKATQNISDLVESFRGEF